jgi:hypothetical protein
MTTANESRLKGESQKGFAKERVGNNLHRDAVPVYYRWRRGGGVAHGSGFRAAVADHVHRGLSPRPSGAQPFTFSLEFRKLPIEMNSHHLRLSARQSLIVSAAFWMAALKLYIGCFGIIFWFGLH